MPEREGHYHLSCIKIHAPKLCRLVSPIFFVHTFDELHVLFRQLKIEYVKVLFQSLQFRCFGNDHCVPLNAPAKSNLGRSFLVLPSQTLELGKNELIINSLSIIAGYSSIKFLETEIV